MQSADVIKAWGWGWRVTSLPVGSAELARSNLSLRTAVLDPQDANQAVYIFLVELEAKLLLPLRDGLLHYPRKPAR